MLTVQEVAEILRVHYSTAMRLITEGQIKGIKIGRQWRIPRSEVERLLELRGDEEKQSPQLEAPATA